MKAVDSITRLCRTQNNSAWNQDNQLLSKPNQVSFIPNSSDYPAPFSDALKLDDEFIKKGLASCVVVCPEMWIQFWWYYSLSTFRLLLLGVRAMDYHRKARKTLHAPLFQQKKSSLVSTLEPKEASVGLCAENSWCCWSVLMNLKNILLEFYQGSVLPADVRVLVPTKIRIQDSDSFFMDTRQHTTGNYGATNFHTYGSFFPYNNC